MNRRLRMVPIALIAAALAAIPAVATAAPLYDTSGPAVTVYNTPGLHQVNGRQWNTTCENYSSTVVRCRTEIWASQVRRVGDSYRRNNGWAFNNLTYLPSNRAAWASNNLGRTAMWTASDGRQWRTECDSPATGRGGCRSYARVDVIVEAGAAFRTERKWVFNNQVLFATSSIPAVTGIPASVIDRAVLTPTGYGPLQIGAPIENLHARYLARGTVCSPHQASDEVRAKGIDLMSYVNGTVGNVWADSPTVPIGTSAGISTFRVGMTVAQLKAAFPGKVRIVERDGEGGTFQAASVQEGDVELLFYKAWDSGTEVMTDADVIVEVRAREARREHFYGC